MSRSKERKLKKERRALINALMFYAKGKHFYKKDPFRWSTADEGAKHWHHDDAGTAVVEDGKNAREALAGLK